jgi:hypothetical protein
MSAATPRSQGDIRFWLPTVSCEQYVCNPLGEGTMNFVWKHKSFTALIVLVIVLAALLFFSDPTVSSHFRYNNF